jgi:hypothetical protein
MLYKALYEIYSNPLRLLEKTCSGTRWVCHEKNFENLLLQYKTTFTRHPNGIQRSPDFSAEGYSIELKSTTSNRIFLNDTFFVEDCIYVISTTNNSIIGLGQDICTEKEKLSYEQYKKSLALFKQQFKGVDRLSLYPRSGTQYCIKDLNREDLWEKVKLKLKVNSRSFK